MKIYLQFLQKIQTNNFLTIGDKESHSCQKIKKINLKERKNEKMITLNIARDKFYIPDLIKYYYKQEEDIVNILAITYFSFDFIECKPENFEEPDDCETLIIGNTRNLKFKTEIQMVDGKEKHIFTEYSLEWGKPFQIEVSEENYQYLISEDGIYKNGCTHFSKYAWKNEEMYIVPDSHEAVFTERWKNLNLDQRHCMEKYKVYQDRYGFLFVYMGNKEGIYMRRKNELLPYVYMRCFPKPMWHSVSYEQSGIYPCIINLDTTDNKNIETKDNWRLDKSGKYILSNPILNEKIDHISEFRGDYLRRRDDVVFLPQQCEAILSEHKKILRNI